MQTSEVGLFGQVIDSDRYPLSEPGSPGWMGIVRHAREDLRLRGCSILPGFIRQSLIPTLQLEGDEMAPLAFYDVETVNAYNLAPDTPLPPDHPGRILMQRGNAFVAWDRIPAGSIIHRLYTSDLFRRFVADCVGLPMVHPPADPLTGLCLNVIPPGMGHPWHFDTNEFAVSVLTRGPDAGGTFEYCPDIRSPRQENLADVADVLRGRRDDLVHRLTMRPGDLHLFRGRYSLHRVSTVRGTTARHSAVFAYSERPGVVGSVARTRQLFGRVEPEHLAAAGNATRSDRLLD